MNLSEMLDMVNANVDDIVEQEDAVAWLNVGKDKMAIAVDADFPDIVVTPDMDDEFVFPKKYHHLPVLYASASYKGYDSSLQEKGSFMQEFAEELLDFVANYQVPENFKDDEYTEQFVAEEGQRTFTITKNLYEAHAGSLRVYINDRQSRAFRLGGVRQANDFILNQPCEEGDRVTAVWDIRTGLVQAPYPWTTW